MCIRPIHPPCLNLQSRLQIVAPAGPVTPKKVIDSLPFLPFFCTYNSAIWQQEGFFAGSKQSRLTDFQAALDDPQIKAILCARGGFGMTTILDDLCFKRFIQHPKWIVGCSDITALLLHLWDRYRVMTIHGPMAQGFSQLPDNNQNAIVHLLTSSTPSFSIQLSTMTPGFAQGPLIGGNLSIITHMLGTVRSNFAQDAILFLEDVTEAPYRIERNLVQLCRSGILEKIHGIVLGEFTRCHPGKDNITVNQVLQRNLAHLAIPVATHFPAAHGITNIPFIHGQQVQLNATDQQANLSSQT